MKVHDSARFLRKITEAATVSNLCFPAKNTGRNSLKLRDEINNFHVNTFMPYVFQREVRTRHRIPTPTTPGYLIYTPVPIIYITRKQREEHSIAPAPIIYTTRKQERRALLPLYLAYTSYGSKRKEHYLLLLYQYPSKCITRKRWREEHSVVPVPIIYITRKQERRALLPLYQSYPSKYTTRKQEREREKKKEMKKE